MTREPYQIIVMRPTGGRAIMTIRSTWVTTILVLAAIIVIALVAMGLGLSHLNGKSNDQAEMIEMLNEKNQDLSVKIALKDEEIIVLKKKMSTAISHRAPVIPNDIKLPKLFPPIAEVADIRQKDNKILFKIVNIKSGMGQTAEGYFFATFRKGDVLVSYPAVKLVHGIPEDKKTGLAFSVRNFKPMTINQSKTITGWDQVTFFIFDNEGSMRLAMPIDRSQIE